MSNFPFQEFATVQEFADMHQVARTTVYAWIRKGLIPYAVCPYMGRHLYLIRKNVPRPVKKTTLPHWLHPGIEAVPHDKIKFFEPGQVADHQDDQLPWYEDQVHMEDLL